MAASSDEKLTLAVSLAVSFGSVGFAKSARIGVSCLREDLTVSRADKLLCGRRLALKLTAVPRGENPDQATLEGFDEKLEMACVADVKRIGVGPDELSFGLTLALNGLDRDMVANFAGRTGRMQIKSSEPIADDDETDDYAMEEAINE